VCVCEQLNSRGRSQEDEDSVRLIEEKEREIEMLREQVSYYQDIINVLRVCHLNLTYLGVLCVCVF